MLKYYRDNAPACPYCGGGCLALFGYPVCVK